MKAVKICLIVLIFSLTALGYVWHSSADLVQITTIVTDVTVTDNQRKIAFNVDTDGLHFGTLAHRGSSGKVVVINNSDEYSVDVHLQAKGPIKKMITFGINDFVLEPHTSENVSVQLSVPSKVDLGSYNGSVKVYFRKR